MALLLGITVGMAIEARKYRIEQILQKVAAERKKEQASL